MSKIRVMIIGCGVISCHWFDYTLTRDDCEIAAVVDLNEELAKSECAKRNIVCPVYTDVDVALAEVKPDLVYDLSYVTTHEAISIKCMKAGCHVFSEKPMTVSREAANNLLTTAKETGKAYFIMQNRRYQKPMQALKDLVKSGKLGNLWMISADIFVPADLKSIRNTLANPMLQDNAIHIFDGARFVTGQEPVSVYCHSYNPEQSKYKGNAAGACIYELSEGCVFVYNCVMGVDGCNTSWESSWRVIGSKGSAVWDGVNTPYAEVLNAEGVLEHFDLETEWNGQDQHFGCLEEMYAAFLGGYASETNGEDNYKSMSMVFSALESAEKGCKVNVK